MSSETEQTSTEQTAQPASSVPEYAPGSVEARLLALDGPASKKALHASRSLKRFGVVFIALGVLALLLEPLFYVLPRLPGFGAMRDILRIWMIVLLPLIVILPAYGVTLRTQRSDAAKWLIRIVSILGIVGGVLEMITMVRQGNIGGFIGELVSVLISLRLCVITYNDVLFGKDAPSHNQLGYVRSKWKAGHRPEHIPEHTHKPPRYAKPCCYIAFLIIPVGLFQMAGGIFDHVNYSRAQEYYEAGLAAFDDAGRAASPQAAVANYAMAFSLFNLAAFDPKNEDVHVYLGLCYARGLGCTQDFGRAFEHLDMHRTATNNFPDAEYELGSLFLYGRGVTRDFEQAALLIQDAARKGQRDAMALLGYLEGKTEDGETTFVEPDYNGMTVAQYLEKKITDEAVRNAGQDEPEEEKSAE